MNHKPLISVVITCYNYAEYIEEAIQSVLSQTYKNISLTIIDDGSTDNSLEVINRYKDYDNVRIITRANKGIVYTRNEALQVVDGEFICFLDADDYFDKDYIENMIIVAEKHRADVVYPNWHIFGDETYTMNFIEFNTQALIRQEIHCTPASLVRRSAIDGHTFQSEKVAEDWDFFLGLALSGKRFKLAKDCYLNYRVRKGTRGSARSYWDDMYYFYEILQKWAKQYPKEVNPVDLPIYAGKMKDRGVSEQLKTIRQRDNTIRDLRRKNEQLSGELRGIRQSRTYKAGRLVVFPLKLLKSIIKS